MNASLVQRRRNDWPSTCAFWFGSSLHARSDIFFQYPPAHAPRTEPKLTAHMASHFCAVVLRNYDAASIAWQWLPANVVPGVPGESKARMRKVRRNENPDSHGKPLRTMSFVRE